MPTDREPLDDEFGRTDDWTERLMLESMLVEGHQLVRCRRGLPPDSEQERVIQNGTQSERIDPFMEELAFILYPGWDDRCVHEALVKHWGREET